MTLLDTNVLIYAFDSDSPHCQWSGETIADAVAKDGAVINAVSFPVCQAQEAGDAPASLSVLSPTHHGPVPAAHQVIRLRCSRDG